MPNSEEELEVQLELAALGYPCYPEWLLKAEEAMRRWERKQAAMAEGDEWAWAEDVARTWDPARHPDLHWWCEWAPRVWERHG